MRKARLAFNLKMWPLFKASKGERDTAKRLCMCVCERVREGGSEYVCESVILVVISLIIGGAQWAQTAH